MIDWHPISKRALLARVSQGEARMSPADLRLWNAIRIEPEKWQQHPYGDQGHGFWALGLIGRSVVWYNDIENGFNRSQFTVYGTIDDYWCNPDELETTLQFLLSTLERGADLVHLVHTLAKLRRSTVK
jgi:hypothetical protein